jgi:hypothetical protein
LDRLPSLLVTDTNIWIDLNNGGILIEVFHLPYKLISPDFAMTELIRPAWRSLQKLGLEFRELEPRLVSELSQLQGIYPHLSLIDLASYLLARELNATLLSGDFHLQQLATQNGITTHGIFWVLDEMVRLELLPPKTAGEALHKIVERGARLPAEECKKRLELWG